ncbi:MAG: hypothetical protein GXO79_07560 [Chlorobi bacterium]|nr:hypothetical protein [Chlorobiota bacterium]
MKSLIINLLTILFILFIYTGNTYAQRCGKKKLCNIELNDRYDYRGQSTYAELYPGDTIRTKIVVYGAQLYDIFACGDPALGAVEFNVIKQTRKYRKVIEDIQEHEQINYKLDEYGDYVYDEYGDYIETGRETVSDTTWKKERYIEEKILFNSLNNKENSNRWTKAAKKTETLVIEVIVPDNASEGCLDLFIGHRSKQQGSFKR